MPRTILPPLALLLLAGCSAGSAAPPPTEAASTAPDAVAPAAARLTFATTDDEGFRPMGEPGPGDWLAQHPEDGQTFEDYAASDPVRVLPERGTLAFVPVGPFEPGEWAVAQAATRFAGLWFDVETRALEEQPLPQPDDWWRDRVTPAGEPGRQYLSSYFLRRLLPRHLPDDAVCLIGVTMADLYPHRSWNYVFGEADLRRRVGVYSLARYFPAFWGEELTDAARTLALRRTLKVVTHEIGHTFGMEHCTFYECNMSGSNSLDETDAYPLRLCPVCLKKLRWNRGFDVLARYRRLAEFCRDGGLVEEADWYDARILAIHAAR